MPPRYRKPWLHGKTGRRPGQKGYWVYWIDDDGRLRSRSYPSKKAALAAMKRTELELNGWAFEDRAIPWPELVDEFADALATRTLAYRRRMANALEALERLARPRSSCDLTQRTLELYLAARSPEIAPATLHSEWGHLRAFFRWCVRSGRLAADPLENVPRPPKVRRIRQAPEADEWVRLLEACHGMLSDGQGWYVLVLLAVTTGLRQSALLRVRVADVELAADESGSALLKAYTTKTRSESLHGLPATVADVLARRISDLPDGQETLFGWPAWPRAHWDQLRAAAGFRFTFHALRAASGTQAALTRIHRAGADALGHSDPQVFSGHYADQRRLALAAAAAMPLPPLPAVPRFRSMPARRPDRT